VGAMFNFLHPDTTTVTVNAVMKIFIILFMSVSLSVVIEMKYPYRRHKILASGNYGHLLKM